MIKEYDSRFLCIIFLFFLKKVRPTQNFFGCNLRLLSVQKFILYNLLSFKIRANEWSNSNENEAWTLHTTWPHFHSITIIFVFWCWNEKNENKRSHDRNSTLIYVNLLASIVLSRGKNFFYEKNISLLRINLKLRPKNHWVKSYILSVLSQITNFLLHKNQNL
jgi:hypothetical protein